MKKVLVLIASFMTLLLVTTSVSAATSGPIGRNGLRAYPGPGKGQVTLEWQRYSLTGENYTVHYGTVPGAYQFLAPFVGYIATYTVSNLQPGQRYYFVLEGIQTGNISAGWDGEVTAVAPRGTVTVVGTPGPIGRNNLIAKPGSKKGTVNLAWKRFFNDTQLYNIVYGFQPGNYIYGVLNAIDTTPSDLGTYTYTVGALQSGRRYYFALVPSRPSFGGGIYVTSEVSTLAR